MLRPAQRTSPVPLNSETTQNEREPGQKPHSSTISTDLYTIQAMTAGLPKQEFTVRASDGHEVPCLFTSNNSEIVIIFAHGITSEYTEDGVYTRFSEFISPKWDLIAFDFRGHGRSSMPTDAVTVAGEVLDLMAIHSWCKQQAYKKIGILATSFGGGIALMALQGYGCALFDGIAMWNPVTNYRNTFTNATTAWGKTFYTQHSDYELASMGSIRIPETEFLIGPKLTFEFLTLHPEFTTIPKKIPLLVLHGISDTLVPHDDSVAFCKRNTHAEFVSLPSVDHGFDHLLPQAFNITEQWLKKIFS